MVRATEASEGTHRMTIKALGDVDQRLKNIESTVQQKKTYAQAVQEAPGPRPCTHNVNTVPAEVLARRHEREASQLEARHLREVVTRVEDPVEASGFRVVPPPPPPPPQQLKQWLEQTGHFMEGDRSCVLLLYRHPSGDVSVLVETEAGRRRLEEDSGWLTCFALSAQIVQRCYQVLVHRVRTKDVDTSNQVNIVKTLQKENRVLHPELKLVGAHWPKSARSKTRSSLILELADVWAANTLIDKGFLVGLQFHTCNTFHQALRLTQCFHCQQYGHVAKQCKARVCCGHCAGAHDTKACKVEQRQKCAVCREAHKVWSSECRARAGALQRTRQLRDVLPLRFVVQTPTEPRKPHAATAGTER